MKSAPAIGTSVRISSRLKFLDGCTGVVTDTPEFWEELGWSRVKIDTGFIGSEIFPDSELEVISSTERSGLGQGDLFGGAQ